jgi:protein-tyrosine phosphatase
MRIRPLIAHPERNKTIMGSPDKIREFTDVGCWLQLTAGSLTGRFGEPAKTTAYTLIDQGYTCLVATDAHDLINRPPLLGEAREALRKRYGDDVAHTISVGRPKQIWGLSAA